MVVVVGRGLELEREWEWENGETMVVMRGKRRIVKTLLLLLLLSLHVECGFLEALARELRGLTVETTAGMLTGEVRARVVEVAFSLHCFSLLIVVRISVKVETIAVMLTEYVKLNMVLVLESESASLYHVGKRGYQEVEIEMKKIQGNVLWVMYARLLLLQSHLPLLPPLLFPLLPRYSQHRHCSVGKRDGRNRHVVYILVLLLLH